MLIVWKTCVLGSLIFIFNLGDYLNFQVIGENNVEIMFKYSQALIKAKNKAETMV